MCSWCPVDVICDLALDQLVCFRVGHVSILSFHYDGGECGTGSGSVLVTPSVLVAPSVHCFIYFIYFCSILVRGDLSEVLRSIDRNCVGTLLDRYGSVYSCTAGSGGIYIVRCVPARTADGRGYARYVLPFLALSLVPSRYEYLFCTGFPFQLLC